MIGGFGVVPVVDPRNAPTVGLTGITLPPCCLFPAVQLVAALLQVTVERPPVPLHVMFSAFSVNVPPLSLQPLPGISNFSVLCVPKSPKNYRVAWGALIAKRSLISALDCRHRRRIPREAAHRFRDDVAHHPSRLTNTLADRWYPHMPRGHCCCSNATDYRNRANYQPSVCTSRALLCSAS
jgi:hypothetical protein